MYKEQQRREEHNPCKAGGERVYPSATRSTIINMPTPLTLANQRLSHHPLPPITKHSASGKGCQLQIYWHQQNFGHEKGQGRIAAVAAATVNLDISSETTTLTAVQIFDKGLELLSIKYQTWSSLQSPVILTDKRAEIT